MLEAGNEADVDGVRAATKHDWNRGGCCLRCEDGLRIVCRDQDRDLSVPSARAGLVVVQFRSDLDEIGQQEASVALRDALAGADFPGVDVEVFSIGILFEELQGNVEDELPPLLGLSFGLIVLILAFI